MIGIALGQTDLSASVPQDLADRLTFLTGQLNAVVLAIRQAQARQDATALASLIAILKSITVQIAQLNAQATAADAPSSFMTALAEISDTAIAAGKEIGADVSTAAKGVAALPGALPDVVKSLAIPLALAAGLILVLYFRPSRGVQHGA